MQEAEGSQSYFRFYPSIAKLADVDGISRGSDYNTAKSEIYSVVGNKLYQSSIAIADVPNSDRVSMAHSQHSQAVSTGGELRLYRYDAEVKTLSNWPAKEVTKGFEKTIQVGILAVTNIVKQYPFRDKFNTLYCVGKFETRDLT